jgi:hypothetical protein
MVTREGPGMTLWMFTMYLDLCGEMFGHVLINMCPLLHRDCLSPHGESPWERSKYANHAHGTSQVDELFPEVSLDVGERM